MPHPRKEDVNSLGVQHLHRGSLSPINPHVSGFGELGNSQSELVNKQGNSAPGSMQIQSSSKFGSYNGLGESSSMLRSMDAGNKRGSSSNKNRPYQALPPNSKGELQTPQLRSLQESGLERDLSLIQNAIFSGGLAPNMVWDPVKQEFVRNNKNTIESDSGLNTPKVMSSGNTGKASPRALGNANLRSNPAKETSKPPYLAVIGHSQSKLLSEGDSESVPSNSQTPRVNLIKNQPSPGIDFKPSRPMQTKLLQLQEDQDESGTPEVSKRVSSSGGLGENSSNWNFHDSSRGQNPGYPGQSSHTTSRMPSRFIEDDDDDDY